MFYWNDLAEVSRIQAFQSCVKDLQQDPGNHVRQIQVRSGMNALDLTEYRDQNLKIMLHSTDRWSVVLVMDGNVVNTWGGLPYRFFSDVDDSVAAEPRKRGGEGKFKNLSTDADTVILFSEELTIEDVDILYETWLWRGKRGETVVFNSADVDGLTDESILGLVSRVSRVKDDAKVSFKGSFAEYRLVIF